MLTLANDQLGPERLVGGEVGINIAPRRDVTWRTTWYDNRVRNPVANVTQTVTPAQTTQQRQNLGRTRIWGIQTDVEYRIGPSVRLAAGYLYNQAKVRGVLGESDTGRQVPAAGAGTPRVGPGVVGQPEVPQRGVRGAVHRPAVRRRPERARRAGRDRAGLPEICRRRFHGVAPVSRNLDVFFGVQNMFDEQYFVGTLPTTIGSPRLVNGGVRVQVRRPPDAVGGPVECPSVAIRDGSRLKADPVELTGWHQLAEQLPMKLIVQPDAGIAPIVNAIKQAKQSINILIFRLDRAEIAHALEAAVRPAACGSAR